VQIELDVPAIAPTMSPVTWGPLGHNDPSGAPKLAEASGRTSGEPTLYVVRRGMTAVIPRPTHDLLGAPWPPRAGSESPRRPFPRYDARVIRGVPVPRLPPAGVHGAGRNGPHLRPTTHHAPDASGARLPDPAWIATATGAATDLEEFLADVPPEEHLLPDFRTPWPWEFHSFSFALTVIRHERNAAEQSLEDLLTR
jgi:hypothetical protein